MPTPSTGLAQGRRDMLVTTTTAVDGRRVREYRGLVMGEAILGANVFRDFFAGIRDIVGGRSGGYEKALREARQIAVREMEARRPNSGPTPSSASTSITKRSARKAPCSWSLPRAPRWCWSNAAIRRTAVRLFRGGERRFLVVVLGARGAPDFLLPLVLLDRRSGAARLRVEAEAQLVEIGRRDGRVAVFEAPRVIPDPLQRSCSAADRSGASRQCCAAPTPHSAHRRRAGSRSAFHAGGRCATFTRPKPPSSGWQP